VSRLAQLDYRRFFALCQWVFAKKIKKIAVFEKKTQKSRLKG
jgi:hypothetical protein